MYPLQRVIWRRSYDTDWRGNLESDSENFGPLPDFRFPKSVTGRAPSFATQMFSVCSWKCSEEPSMISNWNPSLSCLKPIWTTVQQNNSGLRRSTPPSRRLDVYQTACIMKRDVSAPNFQCSQGGGLMEQIIFCHSSAIGVDIPVHATSYQDKSE